MRYAYGKKLLALLLVLTMCMGLFPGYAFAEEPEGPEEEPVLGTGDVCPPHTPGALCEETAATCVHAGNIAYYTCAVCGEYCDGDGNTLTEDQLIIPTADHMPAYCEEVEPTCFQDGHQEYWQCTVCGKYFTDADAENETSYDALVLSSELAHVWGEWETAQAPTATEPGQSRRVCTLCGKTENKDIPATGAAASDFTVTEVYAAIAADCYTQGRRAGFKLSNGEYYLGDGYAVNDALTADEVDALTEVDGYDALLTGYAHAALVKETLSPTCGENGKEYWKCPTCEKHFEDEAAAVEGETVLPATGAHDWGEWVVVTEPTDDSAGLKKRVCAVCQLEETADIPALGSTEPVRVEFACEPEKTEITVYEAERNKDDELVPVLDEKGQPAVIDPGKDGAYLLLPGEYLYDAACEGYTASEKAALVVKELGEGETAQTVEVTLKPFYVIYSTYHINPLYADIIDESELSLPELTQEDIADAFAALEPKPGKRSSEVSPNTSVAQAAEELREAFVNRTDSVEIYLLDTSGATWNELYDAVVDEALAHTGNPDEGDYLVFTYLEFPATGSYSGNNFYYLINPVFYTTAAQETQVAGQVNTILASLNLTGKNDYQKLASIYDWLCSNVVYDYTNVNNNSYKLQYTAYAALVNRTAVCQGISNAFYRMSLQANVDARIVSSDTMHHAWNIARVNNAYYSLDATWNLTATGAPEHYYFLRGTTFWLSEHTLDSYSTLGDQYTSGKFSDYTFPEADCPVPTAGPIAINEANFPDQNFRAWVTDTLDPGNVGVLSVDDCAAVTEINVVNKGIASLAGIEHFPNLQTLLCGQNSLQTLDVSALTGLQVLGCADNSLTTLNLSNNTALDRVHCQSNQLTALTLGSNSNLEFLDCADNSLTSLDLSGCPVLAALVENGTRTEADDGPGNKAVIRFSSDRTVATEEHLARTLQIDVALEDALNVTAPVAIDTTNFPDANFRTYLAGFDSDRDGILSVDECAAVTAIDVNNKRIASLAGIENFPNLQTLDCANNSLTSLDVSHNTALLSLACGQNSLQTLNLSALTGLQMLSCPGNSLESLDVSKNTALQTLVCGQNSLQTLNVSALTGLQVLGCGGNQLTTLNLSQNTALDRVHCLNNQLTALTLGSNSNLEFLDCANNSLTALDVRGCPLLAALVMSGTRTTDANGPGNKTVVRFTGDQAVATEEHLARTLQIDAALEEAVIAIDPVEINETNFPDANFRAWVTNNADTVSDGILSGAECAAVTAIYVDHGQIASLAGIENFPNLQTLSCVDNSLAALDVSHNTALVYLVCGQNSLQTLDVSALTGLQVLGCAGNQLTTLNLSQNTALDRVHCQSNQLTALTLGSNMNLEFLDCADNSLTSLDLSGCPLLAALVQGGQRTEAVGPESTPVIRFTGSQAVATEGHLTRTLQIDAALEEAVIAALPAGINSSLFPDLKFRTYLAGFDGDHDGILSSEERAAVTEIDVHDMGIANLAGLEQFPNLQTLICYGNNLTSLNVSHNTALTKLEVGSVAWSDAAQDYLPRGNKLTALDLSRNTALEYVSCECNNLTALDLSNHTALISVSCYYNSKLTSLNVSGCTALQSIFCFESGLTALDLSNHPNLDSVYCATNKLTSLNVSGCPKLRVLSCGENQLTTLDVTDCTELKELLFDNNRLTTINISGLTSLRTLECFRNNLTSLDVSNNQALQYLDCSDNQLTGLNVSACQTLADLIQYGQRTTGTRGPKAYTKFSNGQAFENDQGFTQTLQVDTVIVDKFLIPAPPIQVNTTLFPNGTFRQWVLNYVDTDHNGSIDNDERLAVTEIRVNGMGITNLKGIEYFPNLQTLECYGNALTSLDVSHNTELLYLNVGCNFIDGENQWSSYGNRLTALDLSKNPKLQMLFCGNNSLTALNLSNHAALGVVECYSNKLTSLNVTGCTALTTLSCFGNSLSTLNLSNLSALKILLCYSNKLTSLNVTGCTALTTVNAFKNALTTLNVSGCEQLNSLNVASNKLTGLTLGTQPSLMELTCSYNALKTLDLSGCTALQAAWCHRNALTSLTLGTQPSLTQLSCFGNKLGALDLSGCANLSGLPALGGAAVNSKEEFGDETTALTILRFSGAGSSLWTDTTVATTPPTKYLVVYDANGGENAPASQLKTYNETLTLTAEAPTRVGYTLLGWSANAKATAPTYLPGANYTANAAVKLYAVWKANTYTVHFEKNADNVTGTMADQVFTYDKAAALRGNAYKRANYALEGWASEADAPTAEYRNAQSVLNLASGQSDVVTLYAVWKALATGIRLVDEAGETVSGTTVTVDMSQGNTRSLTAVIDPAGASQFVTWKSSAAAIATVSAAGLVTFVKPGRVTITATADDGTKKSAAVTYDVYYKTRDAKLTAQMDAVSETFGVATNIGLQEGDSAKLGVTNKRPDGSYLTAEDLTYTIVTKGGEQWVELLDGGVVKALVPGKTVAVKLELTGDPLKRSVTYNVKTVDTQKKLVKLYPWKVDGADVRYVNAAGNLTDNPDDAVSYALYVNRSAIAQTFIVQPRPTLVGDENEAEFEPKTGQYTYTTSDGAIATASEVTSKTAGAAAEDYGALLITVKANASGACTVTATAKDLAKASDSIAVYVMDRAPRLAVASVTLDSYVSGYVDVPLVLSYDNNVTSVTYLDGGYNKSTKRYTSEIYGIVAEISESGDGEVTVRLSATEAIGNRTIDGQLYVETEAGEYWLPLKVVSKSTLPNITVKQEGKFNLFYKESNAWLVFSSAQIDMGRIQRIELVSQDFQGTTDFDSWGHVMELRYADEANYDAPNTKATLRFYLEGYDKPIEKAVTIATQSVGPKLTLSSTAGTFNLQSGTREVRLQLKEGAQPYWLDGDGFAEATPDTLASASYDQETHEIVLTVNENAAKGGKVTLAVQDKEYWARSLSFAYSVTLASASPKLTASALTLNKLWPDQAASVMLTSNQTDTDLEAVNGELTTTSAAARGKLAVSCVAGVVTAWITDASVPNGTYSYTLWDGTYALATVSVKVVNTAPTMKLSAATLSLGGFNAHTKGTAWAYTDLILSDPSFTKENIQIEYEALEEAYQLFVVQHEIMSDRIRLWVGYADDDTVSGKVASYQFRITPVLNGSVTAQPIALKPMTLTVKTTDDRDNLFLPLLKSHTLNRNMTERYSLWWCYADGVSTVEMDYACTSTNAAVRAEAEKIGLKMFADQDDEGRPVVVFWTYLKAGFDEEGNWDVPKAGTYGYTMNVKIDGVQYKAIPITVKVIDTKPKVTLTPAALTLNRGVDLEGVSLVSVGSVTWPFGETLNFTFAGFLELEEGGSYASSDYVGLSTGSDRLYARLTEAGRAVTKNASYKITLTPLVKDSETEEVIVCAPVTLTVSNTSAAQYKVSVAASGKLDLVQRESEAGMLRYTVTGMTGVQGIPTGAVLVDAAGQPAEQFNVSDVYLNEKGQPYVLVSLLPDEEYLVNSSYSGMHLEFHFDNLDQNGEDVVASSPNLTLKLTQSGLKAAAAQATQTVFQSQSWSRWLVYTVNLTSPADAELVDGGVTIGNVTQWQNAFMNVIIDVVDAKTAKVYVQLKDTSKLVAGKSYTLPLEIRANGAGANTAPLKLNLTFAVKA